MKPPRLCVSGLKKHFPGKAGVVRAVDGVSFEIQAGETVALVGESGCGKSTVATTLLGLVSRTAGQISLEGEPLLGDGGAQAAGRFGMVFQNPYSSLNPRMRVREIISEPLRQKGMKKRSELAGQVRRRLEEVGLGQEHTDRYPHEFSGGQRQRIAIARALALSPDVLVLDEPTAALDVSVQAQILNLLRELQDRRGLSYLLISHDLASVETIAHRMLVMYFGKLVETGPVSQIFSQPAHPYTQALLDAIPSLDPGRRGELAVLHGDVPSLLDPPPGCSFAPRCPRRRYCCEKEFPPLHEAGTSREVACYFPITEIASGKTQVERG